MIQDRMFLLYSQWQFPWWGIHDDWFNQRCVRSSFEVAAFTGLWQ